MSMGRIVPGGLGGVGGWWLSEIRWLYPNMLGYTCNHFWTNLVSVMKSKDKVRIVGVREYLMGTFLSFKFPPSL